MPKLIRKNYLFALLLSFATTVALSTAAHASLILHYALNEGSGTTVADTSSNPATGTFKGTGVSWSADTPTGTGYSLKIDDTTSSYVSGGTISKLQGLGDFTITFWTKLSDINALDRIFSTKSSTAQTGYIDLFVENTDPTSVKLKLEFGSGTTATATSVTSEAFDASDWVFVAVTRKRNTSNGTDVISFQVGSTDPSETLSVAGSAAGKSAAANININSGEFRIGSTAATTSNRSPDGLFYDFRIYDSALDTTALQEIRAGTIPEPANIALLAGVATLAGIALYRHKR